MKFKLLTLLLIPFLFLGCNQQNSSENPPETPQKEDEPLISLSHSSIYLSEDKTFQLSVTVDDSLKKYLVFWNIRDMEIATVEDGLVTALKEGSTICSVQVGKYTARCAINVTAYEPEKALSVSLDKVTYNLNVEDEYNLDLEVTYGDEIITDYTLSGDILDSSIVSLNDHKLTALSAGSTDILLTITYLSSSINELIYVNVY